MSKPTPKEPEPTSDSKPVETNSEQPKTKEESLKQDLAKLGKVA
jgi:hypothetical protein